MCFFRADAETKKKVGARPKKKNPPAMAETRLLLECNRTMTSLKRAGRYETALRIMSLLLCDPDYPFPDKISYNIAIDCFGKLGCARAMWDMFVRMIEEGGFRPDVRTFTSMLHSYKSVNDETSACHVLQLMRRMGVRENDHTRSVLRWNP